ncbi:MAG: histidine phosphatase family protein [bacterium]
MSLKLYLVRHAKSSWKESELSDHDRPLNKRGIRDAPLMAKILRKKKITPDLIMSSTAVRALEFAKIIAEEADYKVKKIIATKKLYMADASDMLEMIKAIDDKNKTVFIVSHNPEITYFANSLTNYGVDNIPTSGVFGIEFNTDNWNEADFGKGIFKSFDYPKKYYT